MQVGIPVNSKDYPTNVPANNLSNDELKTAYGNNANQNNVSRSCCDNGGDDHRHDVDAPSFTNLGRNPLQRPTQFNKSSSLGNLSFINIVGLPYHPRQASVPSATTLRNQVGFDGTVFPNHFRNASEPHAVPPRPPRSNIHTNVNVDGGNAVKGAPVTPMKGHALLSEYNTSSGTQTGLRVSSADQITNNNFRYMNGESGTTQTKGYAQENVSNVNVNFYRAVPMNVISAVPTIECINTHSAKNVSNVQIMPLSGANPDQNSCSTATGPSCKTSITSSQVTVHSAEPPTQLIGPTTIETVSSVYLPNRAVPQPQRTFTSTEAQTDDTTLCCPELSTDRERRRRERRERRQNRRTNPVNSRPTGETSTQTNNPTLGSSTIPDILDSHLPPPYTTHPNTLQRNQPVPNVHAVPGRTLPHLSMIPPPAAVPPPQLLGGMVPPPALGSGLVPHPRSRNAIVPNSVPHVSFPPPNVIPGQVPLVQNVPDANSGFRFALPVGQFRREHFSEEAPKGCCGVLTWKPGSLKWFIASIALVAVGCVLVGTALGTMRPAGKDHITVALLMIGIGIVLVTISGVAWRLASQNATSCRTMLGIGSLESVDVCARRFVPRLPPSYGRPHHPYAAMMYPEFQYRPPPPTYQASMQEYRLRLLLIDRANTPQIQAGVQNAVSPPPTYRSHTGSLIRDSLTTRNDVAWSEYSCPPSYRSQTYSSRLGTIHDTVGAHTRDPSLTISEQTNDNAVEVVSILRNAADEDVTLESIKLDAKTEESSPYKLILDDCGGNIETNKEENLVTIVQTDDRNPVIVTVSGTSNTQNVNSGNKSSSEIQILAHL